MIAIDVTSTHLDVRAEPENPINPIPGHSFLAWLRPRLRGAGYEVTEPDFEDWGWYVDVEGPSGRYLIGASAITPAAGTEVDWMVQVRRKRKLVQWFRGRGQIREDDVLVTTICELLRADDGFDEPDATEEQP